MSNKITAWKPNLVSYGKRTKYQLRLNHILILVCIITPCTNWLIPFIARSKLGSVYYVKEN
jgi:hypothetical protein